MSRFHPWRELSRQEHLTLGWHDQAGLDGVYYNDIKTILLRKGLLQVERRCTLAHELAHHRLEHVGCADRRSGLRQELEAEVVAARWLISFEDYMRVRLWTCCPLEMADELWVDVPLLHARQESWTSAERALIRQRLSDAQEWGAA